MQLRPSPFRPWQPLSDLEWQVLAGFVQRPGDRRPAGHRARLDGIFLAATAGLAWSEVPAAHGSPGTLRRRFHRWASEGLFDVLLHAARDPVAPQAAVLRGMEHWLCAAYRRAIPVAGRTVAELLGYASALRPADLREGPSGLSRRIHGLLESVGKPGVPGPSPGPAPARALPLTSAQTAPIRRPLPNTGRGRLSAQAARATAACTAPP